MTVTQAAEHLGRSRQRIYQLIETGLLQAEVKYGLILLKTSEVESFAKVVRRPGPQPKGEPKQ
jgi:excisionase family DNA binding protein